MAIEKKLIVFKKEENFKRELEAGNILPYSWVVIKDSKKLFVQNTEIESVDWQKVEDMIDGKISEIDFSIYLTEEALTNYVDFEDLESALEKYALKSELPDPYDDSAIKQSISNLETNKADKTELENYVENSELSETLSEYAKKSELHEPYDDSAIKADITDLKANKADKTQLNDYLTKSEAEQTYLKEHQSLTDYYKKSETYSKEEIDNAIEEVDVREELKEYAKKSELHDPYDDTTIKNDIADLKSNKADKSQLNNYYQKSETYTKGEVDNLLEEIDVTDQLTDFAKTEYVDSELANKADKTELSKYAEIEKTTVIKTESGDVVKELTIVEGGDDDAVEVYTKEQCDERFMKVWFGSESDYNSLPSKDNNTIYVIQ